MGWERDEVTRMLVRHQWVRDHGTPRVTVLSGEPVVASARWRRWAEVAGRPHDQAPLWCAPVDAGTDWLPASSSPAIAIANESPRRPVAIACPHALIDAFLAQRRDRAAAMIRDGLIRVPPGDVPAITRLRRQRDGAARSQAELTLYEALEATPSTRGRFELNAAISVTFGSRAAEVDLLARAECIAIEIDGFHHFRDANGYRRDRRKDAILQAHGLCVLRFLATDVMADARPAVRTVVTMLAQRLRRKGRK